MVGDLSNIIENTFKVLVGNLNEETAGRPRHGWVINIEMNLTGEGLRDVNRIN
jgi:hypothetical protein